jgi:hypothetical protein
MKKVILSILAIAAIFQIQAADTLKFDAPIQKVQFFLEGAQIETTIDIKLPNGEFVMCLQGLPVNTDPESIRLKGNDLITIHSLEPKINPNKLDPAVYREIRKKLDELAKKRVDIVNEIKALAEERYLLKSNYNIKGNQTLTEDQLTTVADFYGNRMLLIQQKTTKLNDKLEELANKMNEVNISMEEKENDRKSFAEVYIFGETQKEFNGAITITYFVPEAGWYPVYDLFVENTTKPIKLVHKAVVSQNTQNDWKNINVGISNANPVQTNIKPELRVWNSNYNKPTYGSSSRTFKKIDAPGAIEGIVKSEQGNGIPFANVIVEKDGNQIAGTTTDFDGNYSLKPVLPGNYTLTAMSIGYQKRQINDVKVNKGRATVSNIIMGSADISLDEVEVADYKDPLIDKENVWSGNTFMSQDINRKGSRGSEWNKKASKQYSKSKEEYVGALYQQQQQNDLLIQNNIKEGVSVIKGNRIQYNFDKKYDIPKGEKGKYIEYKTTTIPANFKYYAMPEFADESFLIAEITNWDEIKILEGNASVFFEDTWIGTIPLSEKNTKDTINLSIARDPDVIVKKESIDYEADHTLSGRLKKETFSFEISARNSKKETILLNIEDQIPVSQSKEKEVEVIELSGAKHIEKKGFLTWEIELKSGETKKLTLKYSVER